MKDSRIIITEIVAGLDKAEATALLMVLEELRRAQLKHPNWPGDIIYASTIVSEEAGELARASLQFVYENGKLKSALDEATETAAMGLRFLINGLAAPGYRTGMIEGDPTGFAEWLTENAWSLSRDSRYPETKGRWYNTPNPNIPVEQTRTIEELYDEYAMSKLKPGTGVSER